MLCGDTPNACSTYSRQVQSVLVEYRTSVAQKSEAHLLFVRIGIEMFMAPQAYKLKFFLLV